MTTRSGRGARQLPTVMGIVAAAVLTGAPALMSRATAQAQPTASSAPSSAAAVVKVTTHDNRTPAGQLVEGQWTLRLVAIPVEWYPEGDGPGKPMRAVQAFAEEGKAPQIPGPLVRVPEGTPLRVSVRNAIPGATLALHGMVTRPADAPAPIAIPAGETRELRFTAGAPGTYFYWGTTTGQPIDTRRGADGQLTGAFVIDGADGRGADDRVFVMTEYLEPITPTTPGVASYAINGRSWPLTERLEMPFGTPATWRVINGTFGIHPMHLHGTFYTVESIGSAVRDTLHDTERRRLVTTEAMPPGSTMAMRWVPDRVGRWLFHCHILEHVRGNERGSAAHHAGAAGHDIEKTMGGLVLGITVLPGDETAAPDLEPHVVRPLTIRLESWPNGYETEPGYGFSIHDPRAPAADAEPLAALPSRRRAALASPTLVLQKDEPVAITLVNAADEATSIHWHGIELESYHDGVAGWSGDVRQMTKVIEPGDSLEVRFTPPRAGTFIYHTHGHGPKHLSSGLYAPIVVTPPGEVFDPATDKIILLGGSGPASSSFGPAPIEVNRSLNPPPMRLEAGTRYRFRLINITPNYTAWVTLRGDKGPVQWRAVAKDGADLPPVQATVRPARLPISVGETYDFEYEPEEAGDLRLEVIRGGVNVVNAFVTSQVVRVTPRAR